MLEGILGGEESRGREAKRQMDKGERERKERKKESVVLRNIEK